MNTTFGGDNAMPTLIAVKDVAVAVVALNAHVARTQLVASATAILVDALPIIRFLNNILPTPPILNSINDYPVVTQLSVPPANPP
jgi:hypothetical protein